jgi:hypothetical protein
MLGRGTHTGAFAANGVTRCHCTAPHIHKPQTLPPVRLAALKQRHAVAPELTGLGRVALRASRHHLVGAAPVADDVRERPCIARSRLCGELGVAFFVCQLKEEYGLHVIVAGQ